CWVRIHRDPDFLVNISRQFRKQGTRVFGNDVIIGKTRRAVPQDDSQGRCDQTISMHPGECGIVDQVYHLLMAFKVSKRSKS
ncbi:unnamed protein product, partial [Musa acuminata subsp. burmannicoides]